MSQFALRVAVLAHSTNPRGGVVHAMNLSDALNALGVEAVLHAPDASGRGFFRKAQGSCVAFPVAPPRATLSEMVQQRIADYLAWFEVPAHRGFDVYHAHDGISANALRRLKQRGLIAGYARTVHHVDHFADPQVACWERESIEAADALFVVSELWRERLKADFGRDATVGGNGVDLDRFDPRPDGREPSLRARLGLDGGPVFLSLGGVEARKNTLSLLRAFDKILDDLPLAQLVVAGGATLLDHGAYQAEFRAALGEMGRRARRVRVVGPVADADMPALYRLADVVAAPSLNEGFGLAVIEALATEKPVVVSEIEPFVGYLRPHEAHWCDPRSPASIAAALRSALATPPGDGRAVAARYPWAGVARRHLPVYQTLSAFADA
jgi:glycosyltransferase-like protein